MKIKIHCGKCPNCGNWHVLVILYLSENIAAEIGTYTFDNFEDALVAINMPELIRER